MKWGLYICSFAFIILSNNIDAQQKLELDKKYTPEYLYVRVKQFYEFVDRFNYKKDIFGENIDSVFASKVSRSDYIYSLFNSQYLEDKDAKKTADAFIKDVLTNDRFINIEDNKIYSRIIGIFGDKSKKVITLLLKLECSNGCKWVLFSADTNSFFHEINLSAPKLTYITPSIDYLSPVSNETNFINLTRILIPEIKLSDFQSADAIAVAIDRLEKYINQTGNKFNFALEMSYNILSIDGWSVQVKFFNRSNYNSGWLISDIKKVPSMKDNVLAKYLFKY